VNEREIEGRRAEKREGWRGARRERLEWAGRLTLGQAS